jgi:phasin family protein
MTIKPKLAESAITEAPAATAPTFEKTVEGFKHSTATAAAGFETAQAKMKEGYERAVKAAEKFASFQQANLEAFVKSGQILASGLTDLTKHVASTSQANLDETMSNLRAVSSAKSLKEAFDLQAGFARASMEKALSESGKITETSLKLVEEAAAPISARVTAAVETFTVRA